MKSQKMIGLGSVCDGLYRLDTALCHKEPFVSSSTSLCAHVSVETKGVSQFYHLSFDDNKVLKLSIGYAKSLFKCTRP